MTLLLPACVDLPFAYLFASAFSFSSVLLCIFFSSCRPFLYGFVRLLFNIILSLKSASVNIKFSLHCFNCENRFGPFKYVSLASWYHIKLCLYRAQKGSARGKELASWFFWGCLASCKGCFGRLLQCVLHLKIWLQGSGPPHQRQAWQCTRCLQGTASSMLGCQHTQEPTASSTNPLPALSPSVSKWSNSEMPPVRHHV